jgi:hypothetical protein
MAGYLMRLVMRTRETGMTQPIQPFVRSASPIAERDQRLGIIGFEGFDLGDLSPAEVEADSEVGLGPGGVLQPPAPPMITAAGDVGTSTVQRKIARPPAGVIRAATRTAWGEATADDTHLQPSAPQASRRVTPLASGARDTTRNTEPVALSRNGVGAPDRADAHEVLLPPSGRPITDQPIPLHPALEALGIAADVAKSVASTGGIRPKPPNRILAEPTGPLPIEANASAAGIDAGPRIVIGRINVEVVPPPAAPASAAAPRSGPLTAASASVIGPLSGDIRPHLRLSLRHR